MPNNEQTAWRTQHVRNNIHPKPAHVKEKKLEKKLTKIHIFCAKAKFKKKDGDTTEKLSNKSGRTPKNKFGAAKDQEEIANLESL